jgi:cystathionine beta-synthase
MTQVHPGRTGHEGLVYHDRMIDLVGDTPLVRLHRVASASGPLVLAKVESFNPGGSVKDRIALSMVEAAETAGQLVPGGTIVEPTSGNTGVGLAIVAQHKGYRCVFTCPDKVSADKLNVLRALGAEVIVCPAAVPPDDPRSYRSVSSRLAAEIPGAVKLDQYSNAANPATHERTTGPEIWRQTGGRITHFVAGIGTGGTISGTGRALKRLSGGAVRIIGVDPLGSVYAGATHVRPYVVEGVGQPSLPDSYDPAVPDAIVTVDDADALAMTRRLAREEAMLVGPSCGMAVAGALRVADSLTEHDIMVVLLPDSGRGYLSKVFDDEWMARLGFLDDAGSGVPLGAVFRQRHAGIGTGNPSVLHPDTTVAQAAATLRRYGCARLPMAAAPPPVRPAEVLGVVSEALLLTALLEPGGAGRRLGDLPALDQLPHAGTGQPVAKLAATVAAAGAVLLFDSGLLLGVLDIADLAGHLAGVS